MKLKKSLVLVLIGFLAFTACKEKDTTSPGEYQPLNERMVGKWEITGVTYSGVSPLPPPFDTTVTLPFSGVGEDVVGFYDFDTVPNPSQMAFETRFKAPLNFDGGAVVTLTVNEKGWAIYEIAKDENSISGTSYVYNPQNIDTVATEWKVLENHPNKQVWATTRSIPLDNDPNKYVVVDMVTTIER